MPDAPESLLAETFVALGGAAEPPRLERGGRRFFGQWNPPQGPFGATLELWVETELRPGISTPPRFHSDPSPKFFVSRSMTLTPAGARDGVERRGRRVRTGHEELDRRVLVTSENAALPTRAWLDAQPVRDAVIALFDAGVSKVTLYKDTRL